MLKKISIGKKLVAFFLLIGLLPLIIAGLFSIVEFKEAMIDVTSKQLVSMREAKKDQIEHYFTMVKNHLTSESENRININAVEEFTDAFWKIKQELDAGYESNRIEIEKGLKERYRYQKENTYNPPSDAIAKWWLVDKTGRILQHLYISSNPKAIGHKHELDYSLDSSTYSKVHKKYHPILRKLLKEIVGGYYDAFLIEPDTGYIVYSVFKELDFATSLLSGPYKDSNLAKVFKAAIDSDKKDFVSLADFEYYEPSYNQPAAFIASPIYDGENKVGVLVFQIPIDKINAIMTSHRKWKDVGLGSSVETYLVGADFAMRNDSRFLVETPEKYFKQIGQLEYPEEVINKIKSLNTTILLQKVKTPGVEDALKGNSGFNIFPDYRNIPVLSAYTPLEIEGLNWVLMSEIDEDEAFAAANRLRNIIWAAVAFIAIPVLLIGIAAARSISSPIKALSKAAIKIGKGNLTSPINIKSKDEIGQLASSFNEMTANLQKSRNEIILAKEYTDNIIFSMVDMLIVVTPEATIKLVNQATCNLLGYREEELIGRPVGKIFSEELFRETGLDDLIEKGSIHNIEKTCLSKDKRKIPVLFSGSVMRAPLDSEHLTGRDESGKIQGVVCVAQDITERKLAEEALMETQSRLQGIIDNSPTVIYLKNKEGKYLLINRQFEKLFHVTREEIKGKTDYDIFPPKIAKAFQANDRKVLKEGIPLTLEEIAPHDGGIHTYISIKFPLFDFSGASYGICGILMDITERKQDEGKLREAYKELEETQKASLNIMEDLDKQRNELDNSLKEKELLLREVHHRVKNNMQVISSLLSLQSNFVKNKEDMEMFKESQNRIKSMALIHEKLYQSKDLANINFSGYIRNLATDLFRFYNINVNNIVLNLNVKGVSLGIDTAIPCGLIINELISNSLKHAFPKNKKGEIKVSMKKITDCKFQIADLKTKPETQNPQSRKGTLSQRDSTSEIIELVISDNGVSIPEDMDIRNTTSLGMQLVAGLAEEQLEGEIEVNREKGTEFKIRFKELQYKKRF